MTRTPAGDPCPVAASVPLAERSRQMLTIYDAMGHGGQAAYRFAYWFADLLEEAVKSRESPAGMASP